MAQEFLMRFLEIGAINLNSDDTKLEKLRTTAKDLSAALREAPSKTVSFTMVAADPSVPSTDPVVEEAMAALRKRWETVANAFMGRPVNVLRAVLLDAIVQAAREDDAIGVAFVNTARNALAHAETADETPIWRDAVCEIETKVDARAEAEWATPEMISVEPLQYKASDITVEDYAIPIIDRAVLKAKLQISYPSNYQHNSQAWVQEFSDRVSTAIGDTIDNFAEGIIPAPIDFSTPLADLARAVSAHVDKALASFSSATAGLQRRTNLLWWKEALYSPSTHESYLEMPVFQASALMALDLHEQIPTFSPASVSAFLKEAIRCLPTEPENEGKGRRDVLALVCDAKTAAIMQPFRTLAVQYAPAPVGRGPVLSLIGHAKDLAATGANSLRALSGMDESAMMTPDEWGTFLFRELQAARATSSNARKQTEKR